MPPESITEASSRIIQWALREDVADRGDLTSQAVIPRDLQGRADLVARQEGVIAGLEVIETLVKHVSQSRAAVTFHSSIRDGEVVAPGGQVGEFSGSMRTMLTLERTALNFLQRLSGVATLARAFTQLVQDLPCQIYDTRKTTPGWRLLEKHAAKCGGATNHRMGLHDAVMIKDNHLAALSQINPEHGTIRHAVGKAREAYPNDVEIEVEVDTLEQFEEALLCDPDVILLDNMTNDQLRSAVRRRNETGKPIQLEASGGVTLSTVRGIGETGVDRISVGAITHSATALDIGLDYHFS